MPNIKNVRKSVSNSPLMFANAKYAEKTANPTDADVLSIFFLFKIIRTKEIHNIIYSIDPTMPLSKSLLIKTP